MIIIGIVIIGLLIVIAINIERTTTNIHTSNQLLGDILKILEEKENK